MEDFMAVAAQVVGGAVLQEMVSRGASLVLGKRKDKASQGHYLERLRKAIHEVEFVLERTAKLPITEVSLLRDRIELKRDFIQAASLLNRNKKRQAQGQQEISQAATSSSSSQEGLVTPTSMFCFSSFISSSMIKDELWLTCDDVERFEQFADSARSILTKVESGCSLRRWMSFSSPLVRHLFEWKTLIYTRVQAGQERRFSMWPARLEEDQRGVEAHIEYKYLDRKRPDKSFSLWFVLRLSESTDIAGVAMDCLQSLASQFKLDEVDTAMGELTLLANLQDVSHSNAPPMLGIQEKHCKIIQTCRPNPLCCIERGHGRPCVNSIDSTELSHVLPEAVILFKFKCYISAKDCNLRSSFHGVAKRSLMRDHQRPPLKLTVSLHPHCVQEEQQLQASYAVEVIGKNDEECIDVSIQHVGETIRSNAINCFLHQPQIMKYSIRWVTKHGVAKFDAKKRKHIRSRCTQNQQAGPRQEQKQRQGG
ncbi:hypothetical protein SEVIR_2G024000v4 [Setaria viridis]|uniref:Rx N-terminal domain-containing protein n=1 Tax=Setaria viridis TaxID=4556 RepID=A0A4U6VPD8_SETVI|nr:uncharacterized protein LOC117842893 [Setaria viridis]TKW30263.1 hypothetical protein SEVIR_2G024000v2 [Setaria viridis]